MSVLMRLPIRTPGLSTRTTSFTMPCSRSRRRRPVSVSTAAGGTSSPSRPRGAPRSSGATARTCPTLPRLRQGVKWRQ